MSTEPKPLNLEILKEQYRQCHDHFRASDQKRDVILGAYTTITVAFYGFIARIYDTGQQSAPSVNPSVGKEALFVAIVGLLLIGILLGCLFTLYRGWHGLYIIQAIVLQQACQRDLRKVDAKLIHEVTFRFNIFISVELFMFAILHSVLAFHFWFGFSIAATVWAGSCWPKIVVWTLLILVLVEIAGHFLTMYVLDRLKDTGKLDPKYLWLLQGIFSEVTTS